MTDTKTLREYCSMFIRPAQWRATVVLVASTVLMITWKCFGSADFYRQHLAPTLLVLEDVDFTAAAYNFLSSLLLLGAIPALIVTGLFREPLSDYGVRWGDLRKAAQVLLILLPVFLLAAYVGTRGPEVRKFYPLNPSADRAFVPHAVLFFSFYVGWEFHFRGFLQNGLRDVLGETNAILIQTMASTLLHIGTPTMETYMAIVAGIMWGVIMCWTRSLLAGLILHFSLGIFADYFLLFHGN